MDKQALLNALTAKRNHLQSVLSRSNVIACGVGYKVTDYGVTDELAIVASVVRKLPVAQLAESELVPRQLDGVKTDVIETGEFQAFQTARDRWRPLIPPGVSVGHLNATAGTFGCLVRRGNETYILSNNHVLANANHCKIGDPILQPGRHDGGVPQDRVGTLADFVPLDFGSDPSDCSFSTITEKAFNFLATIFHSQHRMMAFQETPGSNRVDAALARLDNPAATTADIIGIGRPRGQRRANLGTQVKKSGRTTGYTEGRIIQIDVTSQVAIGPREARFEGQYMTTPMSEPGDSGAAVLDKQNYVIGLLFAGSDAATLINPIQAVLQALRIQIVT